MSEIEKSWDSWVADAKDSPEFAAEDIKLDFAVALERRMEQQTISRSDLAKKLGTSAAAITQTLRGDANLSIERMARLAHAVGAVLHVHLSPAQCKVRWFEVYNGSLTTCEEQLNHAQAWANQSTGTDHGNQRITYAA